MRSLTAVTGTLVIVGCVEGRAAQVPTPVVTPGPTTTNVEMVMRDGPDAVSLAMILLTAVPESLRQIAATDVPAVSSILWNEFLDDKRPEWFQELPLEIQNYLIEQFGPATAISSTSPFATTGTEAGSTWHPVETHQSQPAETSYIQPTDAYSSQSTEPSPSATESIQSSEEGASSLKLGSDTTTNPTKSSHIPVPTLTETGLYPTDSLPPAPVAESESQLSNKSGLTKSQKVGLGLGVSFGILVIAIAAFGCCLLFRRRHRKKVDGSVPPSSPGFIPRFAFQENKAAESEQHRPLNRGSNSSFGDLANMTWDDEVIDTSSSGESVPTLNNHFPQPIMAPALYHTHSSNRARGKRTSYTSLHSVAEVSEPDEIESPILGRHTSPKVSPLKSSPPRPRAAPPVPAASQIKRKPVPFSLPSGAPSPALQVASRGLLHQTISGHYANPQLGNYTHVISNASPCVSPIEELSSRNPFSNNYGYEEDYGPEYHHHHHHNDNNNYIDIENGLYGGHTSLSRYPEPKPNKPEWPLRNFPGHRRNKSPLWDRVYDG